MKIVKQIGFSAVFKFAETQYGISWNVTNDIFFHNVLSYKSVTDFYMGEWQGNTSFWKDETSFNIKASSFTKDEVLDMNDSDKANVILAAYLESLGLTGDDDIQIDCR